VAPVVHNFTIRDTPVDIDTQRDEVSSIESVGEIVPPGPHQFFCKYHKTKGMVGDIRLVS
jgi:plastocyanin